MNLRPPRPERADPRRDGTLLESVTQRDQCQKDVPKPCGTISRDTGLNTGFGHCFSGCGVLAQPPKTRETESELWLTGPTDHEAGSLAGRHLGAHHLAEQRPDKQFLLS